jgi:hypothetical protein
VQLLLKQLLALKFSLLNLLLAGLIPSVNATVPSAGYVSDMLEAPAPGASVLRVTGNVEA